ncbi:Crp/Fnr family transcriptional regulator [Mariniflexile gromovii]|uniref:Crp/Fnr family transcriptional regulator n=1 Tax=Mariniflexile gromovii TaxID=362523 RepID=A0ABS4BNX0_9FLAO|nr:Crp/Fnr family transcriptional regulator [Mariniflexile gromovii]MBP0902227.1 Crp/Fnr family transcriptional regulator [Mariniflexile gromovii]
MNLLRGLLSKIIEENAFEKSVHLKKNEYLKIAGSSDTNLYYVEEGALSVYSVDKFEEHIVCIGYKKYNDLVLDLESFITEKSTDYYIQAIKKSEVKAISKKRITLLLEQYPHLNKEWSEFLEKIILIMYDRVREIFTSTPDERYFNALKENPHLFQEIPSKYIASYLRMTPETLSRIKKY